MRIRIKFTKEESIRYLGHLDEMRAFQKCFNRTDIKMSYSEGFNPHQKMSFALPLGVGQISEAEYVDAVVEDGQKSETIFEKLSRVSDRAFRIINVNVLDEKAEKAMAAVRYADYEIAFYEASDGECKTYAEQKDFTKERTEALKPLICKNQLEDFLEARVIMAEKKTKSGIKQENIRPMIISAHLDENILKLRLKAGSAENLKPQTVLDALNEKFSCGSDYDNTVIKRTELFGENFVPLYLMGR